MTGSTHSIEALLGEALGHAAEVARGRLGRGLEVVAAELPQSEALLRFDVTFGGEDRLSWLVTNEDAIGLADLLIGGSGDRSAQPTEIHLDALSGLFSDLLERAVGVLGERATGQLAAGGVDMGMEGAVPPLEEGGVQAVLAIDVEGFGPLVVVQQATPGLAARLAGAQPAAVAPAPPEAAAPEAPAPTPAAPDAASEAAPAAAAPAPAADAGAAAPTGDQSAIDSLLEQAGIAPDAAPATPATPAAAPAAADEAPPAPAGPPPAAARQPAAAATPPVAAPNVVDLAGHRSASQPAPVPGRGPADLAPLLNVPLPITVELGNTQRTVRDLVEMGVGTIIELQKLAGDPLEIKVHDRVIARGEVVVIDEEFGIRVTEIVSPEERLRGLGS